LDHGFISISTVAKIRVK